MTDNTQELDEILGRFQGYAHNIATGTQDFGPSWIMDRNAAKQALLDWHNKQMLAELGDSLHNDNLDEAAYSDIEHRYDKYFDKLKESKDGN